MYFCFKLSFFLYTQHLHLDGHDVTLMYICNGTVIQIIWFQDYKSIHNFKRYQMSKLNSKTVNILIHLNSLFDVM
jgi:hypothetical protein